MKTGSFSTWVMSSHQTSMPPTTEEDTAALRHFFPVAIAAAMLVGLLLRWVGLGSQSLWWDEGFTLWISKFSPSDIIRGLQFDTSPPLYYFLEHYWMDLFGSGDTALRGLSAFFETLSFPLFFLLVKAVLVEKKSIATATWLFALSTFQIMYAREARCYGLLSLLSVGTLYCLVRLLERRSGWFLLSLVVLVSAGVYTHNMMLFYLPAIAAFWLIYPSPRSCTVRAVELSLTMILVLLLYLPWIPSLLRQTQSVEASFWVPRPTVRTLLESLCNLSGIEPDYLSTIAQRLLHIGTGLSSVLVLSSAVLIFLLCVVGSLFRTLACHQRKYLAMLAYMALPVLLVFATSRLSTPVYLDRTFIASSIALPILYCAPIAFRTGSSRSYSYVALVPVLMIAVSLWVYLRYSAKEDWRGLVAHSTAIDNGRRLTVFIPYQAEILYDHYRDRLATSDSRIQETGLPVPFDFQNPVRLYTSSFPTSAAFEAFVKTRLASIQYHELDVVFSHVPDEVARTVLETLKTQCAGVIDRDFRRVRFVRCIMPNAD